MGTHFAANYFMLTANNDSKLTGYIVFCEELFKSFKQHHCMIISLQFDLKNDYLLI